MKQTVSPHHATFESFTWPEIRSLVHEVNPELAQIVDSIGPDDSYKLYRADYPFGATIANLGQLHIPNGLGRVVRLSDNTIDKAIRADLNYNPVPVALNLHHNAEVYVIHDSRFVPLKVFTPGEIFGVWELLDPPTFKLQAQNWSFSAGARSLFMVPKITESTSHAKLRQKYSLRPFTPKGLLDHQQIFSTIANHPNFSESWQNSILFFGRNWVSHLSDPPESPWYKLNYFWLRQAWLQSLNWRNQLSFELIWQSLAQQVEQRNLKPRRYIIDTVKHLITVGTGTAPAFAPAIDNQSAPVQGLQSVYVNDYHLKNYLPTIMEPRHLNTNKPGDQVYYSLQSPTLLTYSSHHINTRSILQDLRDLKFLIDILMEKLESDKAPILALVKNLNFEFFHSEVDTYGEILSSNDMVDGDPQLSYTQDDYPDRRFAETGPFVRGCIRLSIRENDDADHLP